MQVVQFNGTEAIAKAFSRIMCFVLSQIPRRKLLDRWSGYPEPLAISLFEYAEADADAALLRFAIAVRILDERDKISAYLQETSNPIFGFTKHSTKASSQLNIREVANKIIHSESFEWGYSGRPSVVCHAAKDQHRFGWETAEIDLEAIGFFVAMLAIAGPR